MVKYILKFKIYSLLAVAQYFVPTMQDGSWIISECQDPHYIPIYGSRRPNSNLTFFNGSILRYSCDFGFILQPDISTQQCVNGNWIPSKPPICVPTCHDHRYVPLHGSRIPMLDFNLSFFPNGTILKYFCDDYYTLQPDISTQQCVNKKWIPSKVPNCVHNRYCSHPSPFANGVYICCENSDFLNKSDYCCPPGGNVQFECKPNYTLNSGDLIWSCSSSGKWNYETSSHTCDEVSSTIATHPAHPEVSDGMLKTLIGVITGVLSLLLIVVAFTFCRPRLQDIKRRWRDIREDETGLIIDGRRVALPSYEQAVSGVGNQGWPDLSHQFAPPLNHLTSSQINSSGDVTSPPVSNLVSIDSPVLPATSCTRIGDLSSVEMSGHDNYSFELYDDQRPSTSRDQVTAIEFLRESSISPCGAISSELSGFEDNFIPIAQPTQSPFHLTTVDSPTSSLSSTDADVAPLLAQSTRLQSRSMSTDVIIKNPTSCEIFDESTIPAAHSNNDEIVLRVSTTAGEPLNLDHLAKNNGGTSGCEHNSRQADSTAL